ncbi:MAG: hypothetical protein U0R78_15520 [Nocardioidaceae bacterium]
MFFRNPRPDAVDPVSGERYDDVIVVWVPDDGDKQALVEDPATPFFTTPHFDGHPSVLVRASRLGEPGADEVREVVQDAWLSEASARRRDAWLRDHPTGGRQADPSPALAAQPGGLVLLAAGVRRPHCSSQEGRS